MGTSNNKQKEEDYYRLVNIPIADAASEQELVLKINLIGHEDDIDSDSK